VARALPRTLRERRAIQAARALDAQGFAALLRSELDSPYFGRIGASPLVRGALTAAWWAVRRLAGVR
jgi:hypothetical protein